MALILSGNGLQLSGAVVLTPVEEPAPLEEPVQTETGLPVFTEAGLEITIE